jgi:tetratricopeptide (TPR) repeat protein
MDLQGAGAIICSHHERWVYNLEYRRADMEIPVNMCRVRVARRVCGAGVSGAMRRKLWYCCLLAARLLSKELAVCAFVAVFLTPSLSAQQNGSANSATPGWPLHNSAPDHALPDAPGPQPPNITDRDESCSLWTVAEVQGPTISAATLQVPGKARGEYRKGCSDLKGKKLENAENHLRKALQEYPRYAAAWVLLGQVLEAGNRIEEARGACSQASGVDSGYAPAYLCLADVAAQLHEWNQTLDMADRALALAPVHDVYGYFYSAIAQFHLSHLPAAERNALQTIEADHLHRVPQTHLLLAEIYGAKHDLHAAAVQLRAYLRVAPSSPDSADVRKSLAELEGQIPQ